LLGDCEGCGPARLAVDLVERHPLAAIRYAVYETASIAPSGVMSPIVAQPAGILAKSIVDSFLAEWPVGVFVEVMWISLQTCDANVNT
jgi:hypothetical protein